MGVTESRNVLIPVALSRWIEYFDVWGGGGGGGSYCMNPLLFKASKLRVLGASNHQLHGNSKPSLEEALTWFHQMEGLLGKSAAT